MSIGTAVCNKPISVSLYAATLRIYAVLCEPPMAIRSGWDRTRRDCCLIGQALSQRGLEHECWQRLWAWKESIAAGLRGWSLGHFQGARTRPPGRYISL